MKSWSFYVSPPYKNMGMKTLVYNKGNSEFGRIWEWWVKNVQMQSMKFSKKIIKIFKGIKRRRKIY